MVRFLPASLPSDHSVWMCPSCFVCSAAPFRNGADQLPVSASADGGDEEEEEDTAEVPASQSAAAPSISTTDLVAPLTNGSAASSAAALQSSTSEPVPAAAAASSSSSAAAAGSAVPAAVNMDVDIDEAEAKDVVAPLPEQTSKTRRGRRTQSDRASQASSGKRVCLCMCVRCVLARHCMRRCD